MGVPEEWRLLAQAVIGETDLTPVDVAEQSGIPIEEARRLWRALGLPPVPDTQKAFTPTDVAMLRGVRELLDRGVIDEDLLVQMTRVAGQSMARMAEAQVAAALERAQGSGPAGGLALMRSIDIEIVPKLEVILGYVWRRHLLAAAWRQFAAADAPDNGAEMAVGFADLVGFTALSQQLRPSELAAVVDRFEVLVYEHVPERHGRVVKMIGDEAMFVADDMTAAAEIALGLVEAHAAEEMLPELRVGLAFGSALSWEGDYFGATVNLASRLVNVARPGTILVSERAAELLRDNPAFLLRPMRPLHLKGIGRSRVAALRRAGDPGRKPSGSRPAG